jgi:hypothetical protein
MKSIRSENDHQFGHHTNFSVEPVWRIGLQVRDIGESDWQLSSTIQCWSGTRTTISCLSSVIVIRYSSVSSLRLDGHVATNAADHFQYKSKPQVRQQVKHASHSDSVTPLLLNSCKYNWHFTTIPWELSPLLASARRIDGNDDNVASPFGVESSGRFAIPIAEFHDHSCCNCYASRLDRQKFTIPELGSLPLFHDCFTWVLIDVDP